MRLRVIELGCVEYGRAWELQRRVAADRAAGAVPDTLLLLEHPPTVTIGRGADHSHLLLSPEAYKAAGIAVEETDRGGDVTYHGPGQLVGYPIIDLRTAPYGKDLHRFLRQIELSIILALEQFGICGGRLTGHTGVWVTAGANAPVKVAAIGLRVSRWVTMHGFALNVCPRMNHFDTIVPCGLHEYGVASMSDLLGQPLAVTEVIPAIRTAFAEVFERSLESADSDQDLSA